MSRIWPLVSLLMPVFLLTANVPVAATSFGRVVGVVVDEQGEVVPGAVLSLVGVGGVLERTDTTDHHGGFRLERVRPGQAVLSVSLSGFVTVDRPLLVELNRTHLTRVVLVREQPELSATDGEDLQARELLVPEVLVVGRAPAVDLGTSAGVVLQARELERLPFARDTDAAVILSPGAGHDGKGLTFRGASAPESVWLVDGMDTTHVGIGMPTSTLPLEFVEQISVRTGGYSSEYGGAAGGIVDTVVRSGGEEYRGGLVVNYSGGLLTATVEQEQRPDSVFVATSHLAHQLNLTATLGGPLIAERAWFFVGIQPSLEMTDYTRELYPRGHAEDGGVLSGQPLEAGTKVFSRDVRSLPRVARLDYRSSDSQRGRLTYYAGPVWDTGVVEPSLLGDDAAVLGRRRSGASMLTAAWSSSLFGGGLLLDAQLGSLWHVESLLPLAEVTAEQQGTRHEYPYLSDDVSRYTECLPADPDDSRTSPCAQRDYLTGPFWIQEDSELARRSATIKATSNVELFGPHILRLGADLKLDKFLYRRGPPGGSIQRDFGPESEPRYQRAWFGYLGEDGEFISDPLLETDARGRSITVFLHDTWDLRPGLVVESGVRLESRALRHPSGGTALTMRPELAPRVGVAWDFTGSGQARLHAHVGRFHQRIPLNVVARAFAESVSAAQFLASDGTNMTPLLTGQETIMIGDESPWVQPRLRAPYHDEVQIGIEYAVKRKLAVGAMAVHRNLGRAIEDVALDDDARRFAITNPGDEAALLAAERAVRRKTELLGTDAPHGALEEDLAMLETLRAFPRPTRTYNALELTARTALGGPWFFKGSLVLSRLFGNYSGFFAPENNQLDPNVTTQFDLPELLVNRFGPLRQDRPVRLRLDGLHRSTRGLSTALSLHYSSGRPIDLLGTHHLYGRREVFILPRGAGGRTPSLLSLDAALGYPIRLPGGAAGRLNVAVSNIFDSRRAVEVEDAYTFHVVRPIDGGTVDELRDPHGGSLLVGPDGQPVNLNPGWGRARSTADLQPPRQLQIGLSVEF